MSDPASSSPLSEFPSVSCFRLSIPAPLVLTVELASNKLNTLTRKFWTEIITLFRYIAKRTDIVRCVILTNSGDIFTAGLDLKDHNGMFGPPQDGQDVARKAIMMKDFITLYQLSASVLEEIPQPVIAAIHGPCIGGGVDIVLAADIRMVSEQAYFAIKEVDIGLAADVNKTRTSQYAINKNQWSCCAVLLN